MATFDLSADVIDAIKDGTILFAVDQQPYVQGYLGVTGLYLKSINGNDIGGGQPVYSGPAFVTKDNADAVVQVRRQRHPLTATSGARPGQAPAGTAPTTGRTP